MSADFGRSYAQQNLEFNASSATVARVCQEVLTRLGEVISASPITGVIHGTVKRGLFNYDTDIMIRVHKTSESKTTISIDASRERMAASPMQEAHVDLAKFAEALMMHPSLRSSSPDGVGWVDEKSLQQPEKTPEQPTEQANPNPQAKSSGIRLPLLLLLFVFIICVCFQFWSVLR